MSEQATPIDIEALYRHHHGWLVGVLRNKLRDREHAADLAQDTFTRLLVTPAPVQPREPRAYLRTVASRLAAQYFRRQALERAYLDALARQPEAQAPSAETRALALEALAAVSRVLDALPARTRAIFLLAQLDGLTYPGIAAELGVTVNVVQKAMIKAFQHCYAAVYG